MHEFSLMVDLLRKILQIAHENGSKPVKKVTVQLGALAHITPEHFSEHFADATRGTLAEGAELNVIEMNDAQDPNAQDILLQSIEIVA